VDYDEVYAPVARLESVRLLLALAAHGGWAVHHMDVKTAFLNGELDEEVYVTQPPGFETPGSGGKVLRLRKALYGLKQAPRAWNAKLDSVLKNLGFTRCPSERAMYKRGEKSDRILLGIYVDDLIITGSSERGITAFKEEMKRAFRMSDLGKLSFYLGLEVLQNKDGIMVTQTAYAQRILEKCGMGDCNPCTTPTENRLKLTKNSTAATVDATEFRSTVGSLRYLVHTRPDITFAVSYVSRFMERPTVEHQAAVKHVLRYIAGTLRFGCWFAKGTEETRLTGFSDSDHAGDQDDRKSTSGLFFFLGSRPISWQSQKQKIVSLSSCEAEYIAGTGAVCQGVWLARLLGELTDEDTRKFELFIDNKSAISLSKNPVFHDRSKHIDLRYHFIRECAEVGKVEVKYVNTEEQLADILTKPLGRIRFQELRSKIGMKENKIVPRIRE
jgi:hypothetical protein